MEIFQIIDASDDVIRALAKDNICNDWRDYNGKFEIGSDHGALRSIPHTVVDSKIFGSSFADSCNCGLETRFNKLCYNCGSARLKPAESLKRYGYIDLPVMYLGSNKLKAFNKFFNRVFPRRVHDFQYYRTDEGRIPIPDLFELFQFGFNPDTETLIITDMITDLNQCSYEGILDILTKYYPNETKNFHSLVNQYVLVCPIAMRPTIYANDSISRYIKLHDFTYTYKSIIAEANLLVKGFQTKSAIISRANNLIEANLMNATFRRSVTRAMEYLDSVSKGSKDNALRNNQALRKSNSGRCTITPGPGLKLDEVSLPISLVFEAAMEEFALYLTKVSDEYDFNKALKYIKKNFSNKELLDTFRRFVKGDPEVGQEPLTVLINRAPTLHEGSIVACHVVLNYEDTMRIPLSICSPLNADFDGDTMSFYVVPNSLADLAYKNASARYRFWQRKDLKPLYLPKQEILQGLIMASVVNQLDSDKMKSYDKFEDAARDFKSKNLTIQESIMIGNRTTTYGRECLSKRFGFDIDEVIGGLIPIDNKNVVKLYENLVPLDDRIERINEVEKFSQVVVTAMGTTTFTINQLLVDIDPKYYDEIQKIYNSKLLTTEEKNIRYKIIYDKYAEDLKKVFKEKDPQLYEELNIQSRTSPDALVKLTLPPNVVDLSRNYKPAKTSLAQGMSPEEYINYNIASRGVAEIKQVQVPSSGNTTRLIAYVEEFFITPGEDINNPGILIRACDAEGRTTIDGDIVPRTSSEELIRVRSMLTSTLQDKMLVTRDMVTNKFKYEDGQAAGKLWATSWTESLTQSALALKHKGELFSVDESAAFIAKSDCTLEEHDNYFIIRSGSTTKKYPKPINFVRNAVDEYHKDDIIAVNYNMVLPSYKLNQIIKLIATRFIDTKRSYGKNNIVNAECYAYESGKIKYEFAGNKVTIRIGSYTYDYNPYGIYFYADGDYVEKGTRICSGLLDLNAAINQLGNLVEVYYLFDKQITELTNIKVHELNEAIFKSILIVNNDNNIRMRGVLNSIKDTVDPIARLSFEDPKSYLRNKLAGAVTDLVEGPMSLPYYYDIFKNGLGRLENE